MRLKLTLAYVGTGFRGWARQPGERTVEGELREALDAVFGLFGELSVAGRTDAGVHALANVVSADVQGGPPVGRAVEALNAVLPEDIAVIAAEEAPGDFHARFSARSRSYRYRIWRRRERSPFELHRALWHPRPLDLERLNRAAAQLVGEHDFRAFTPTDTQHEVFVRVVAARRAGTSAATRSSSRSPPTRSCATWCERLSERCSSASPTRSRSSCAARLARPPARRRRPGGST